MTVVGQREFLHQVVPLRASRQIREEPGDGLAVAVSESRAAVDHDGVDVKTYVRLQVLHHLKLGLVAVFGVLWVHLRYGE